VNDSPQGEGKIFWKNRTRCEGKFNATHCSGKLVSNEDTTEGTFRWKFDHEDHFHTIGNNIIIKKGSTIRNGTVYW